MTHELKGLDLIPEYYREGMRIYIEDGIRPELFLTAILSNDLFKTHLFDINCVCIPDFIVFLTEHAPPNCFGSRAKVEAWLEDAAERRALAQHAGAQP